MKIVHVNTSLSGGAGKAMLRLHNSMLKHGIDSNVLSLDESEEFSNNKLYKLTYSNRLNPRTHFSFFEKVLYSFKLRLKKYLNFTIKSDADKIKEVFDSLHPKIDAEIATLPFSDFDILNYPIIKDADIIHLHWTSFCLDYPSFFKNNSKPLVWTLHDMNPFLGIYHYSNDMVDNSNLTRRLDKKILSLKKKYLKKNQTPITIISPSKWMLKEARESRIFKNSNIQVICNTINIAKNHPIIGNNFRKNIKINDSNLLLLFIANSIGVKRKGFDLLIDALKCNHSQRVTLLVLGITAENIIHHNLDIRYLGNLENDDEIFKYYSNVDAVVIPSLEDNLPNVMLESFACGTPVLAFPIGGLNEHIINYKTGLLCANLSSESLSDCIEEFSNNMYKFNRKIIQSYALDNFGEINIVNQHFNIYKQLLNA